MARRDVERRRHKRFPLPCPARIIAGGSREARGKTVNVSDGGMFVAIPISSPLPACYEAVDVVFSLPRSTPNTYMLEEVSSTARVLRHQALKNDRLAGLALQFAKPLNLAVEV
jgi:c-di-GMP-binding flagellar brake protein YcgR